MSSKIEQCFENRAPRRVIITIILSEREYLFQVLALA